MTEEQTCNRAFPAARGANLAVEFILDVLTVP